jgi:hypothetical protein
MKEWIARIVLIPGALLMMAAGAAGAEPRVIGVTTDAPLKLGGPVLLKVENLSALLEKGSPTGKRLVLFVDGNELTNVVPSGIFPETDTLRFDLRRTAANKSVWSPLLKNPISTELRSLWLSVGWQGERPIPVDPKARGATLQIVDWDWMTGGWVAIFIALVVMFLIMAFSSDILRNPPDAQGKPGAYSLSRVQAAFWLFLTTMSFAFIFVVTSDLTTLNSTVLTLLGISAGTYLASTMLDPKPLSKEQLAEEERQAKEIADKAAAARKDAAAKAQIAETAVKKLAEAREAVAKAGDPADKITKEAAATIAETDSAKARKDADDAAINADAAAAKLPKPREAGRIESNFLRVPILGRFLDDILTDEHGLSVHRFQIFVWTIVLGIIFLISVLQDLVMPEFSATLLGLMGISSATYLAPKINTEK